MVKDRRREYSGGWLCQRLSLAADNPRFTGSFQQHLGMLQRDGTGGCSSSLAFFNLTSFTRCPPGVLGVLGVGSREIELYDGPLVKL